MLPTAVRRFAPSLRLALDGGPYKAKRHWPPDFDKLSHKHQFQLERRYRRRAMLKWARPGWTKATTLAQYGIISFVIVYAALFLNWGDNTIAFDRIRAWYAGLGQDVWTKPAGNVHMDPEGKQAKTET